MGLKINGSTDGSIEVDVPASCGSDLSVTLPATAGEIVVANTSGDVDLGGLTVSGSAADDSVNVDSSGRLLVGTSSSSTNDTLVLQGNSAGSTFGAQLRLRRNATIGSGSGIGDVSFEDSSGNQYAVISGAGDGTSGSGDYPGRLVFSTTADGASSPTERMRIDSAGNVMISGNIPSSGQKTIWADSSADFHVSTTSTTGDRVIWIYNGNGRVGGCVTSGSNTNWETTSDYRLKENVVTLTNGIERLKQLQPKRYNFITDPDTICDGFLAHEAQEVVPQAVSGTKDQVDENGEIDAQGIDLSKIVPLLTAALQEAIAKIETLEAKVAALEAN